jgi:hypothetical protein
MVWVIPYKTSEKFLGNTYTLHDVNTLIRVQLVRFSYFFDEKHVVDADFYETTLFS